MTIFTVSGVWSEGNQCFNLYTNICQKLAKYMVMDVPSWNIRAVYPVTNCAVRSLQESVSLLWLHPDSARQQNEPSYPPFTKFKYIDIISYWEVAKSCGLFTSCKKQSKESSETSRSSGFWIPPFLETTFCIRTKHMINPSCYSSSLTSELEWCFFLKSLMAKPQAVSWCYQIFPANSRDCSTTVMAQNSS